MRVLMLVMLAGCWRSSPAPPPPPTAPAARPAPPRAPMACEDRWLLLRSDHGCADMRSSVSGYRVMRVVDGTHRDKIVVGAYSPSCPTGFGDWNLTSQVLFGPSVKNDCTSFVGPDCKVPDGHGMIETWHRGAVESFRDEASARAARDERCKEGR